MGWHTLRSLPEVKVITPAKLHRSTYLKIITPFTLGKRIVARNPLLEEKITNLKILKKNRGFQKPCAMGWQASKTLSRLNGVKPPKKVLVAGKLWALRYLCNMPMTGPARINELPWVKLLTTANLDAYGTYFERYPVHSR